MLLTVLKITGMVLLILVAVLLLLVMLVLFVPVRYRIAVRRKEQEQNEAGEAVLLHARVRVSWLLHLISVAFDYPEKSYVRGKVLGITVFRSDREKKPKKEKKRSKTKKAGKESGEEMKSAPEAVTNTVGEDAKEKDPEQAALQSGAENRETGDDAEQKGIWQRVLEFFGKISAALKNIQYTIRKICDKIKQIVRNIRHYLEIIQSDAFGQVWKLCSSQVLMLLKSIRPRKIRGEFLIGAGDPATTGDIMAVYGMLYPVVGNPKSRYYLAIIPDFEQKIVEGKLQVKGKITVFQAVKAAWKIYFHKDMRKLIKMFKREAA